MSRQPRRSRPSWMPRARRMTLGRRPMMPRQWTMYQSQHVIHGPLRPLVSAQANTYWGRAQAGTRGGAGAIDTYLDFTLVLFQILFEQCGRFDIRRTAD